jgi:RimJ/RimL family protein N-acetyltransferase
MRLYNCIEKNIIIDGKYSIVPIRDEDKFLIMKWRNEQFYHLRQSKILKKNEQLEYFRKVVSELFEKEYPDQLLFSYLENEVCIGYGGLVHINWIDKNAEISFLLKTELENEFFEAHWSLFLKMIEKVAFIELNLRKIFTYAFDLRPRLFKLLEMNHYFLDARLKDQFIDVLIHYKINPIFLRKAGHEDLNLIFRWANEEQVRNQSFNSEIISINDHKIWYKNSLRDENCLILIGENPSGFPIGQVRFNKLMGDKTCIIAISIDADFRNQGLGSKLIEQATKYFLKKNQDYIIKAYIKIENIASSKSFLKAGFKFEDEILFQGQRSVLYTKVKL